MKEAMKNIIFMNIDVDEQKEIAEKFGIIGVPAGILFKVQNDDLIIIERHEGMLEKKEFLGFIAK